MEPENEDTPSNRSERDNYEITTTEFKKPILVGKIGKLPKKVIATKAVQEAETIDTTSLTETNNEESSNIPTNIATIQSKPFITPAQQITENVIPLPYKEPNWSGLPSSNGAPYVFEVLKSGVIVDRINLMSKPFWVFGRTTTCEICMTHPTISRYHAVLQFRSEGAETDPPGFYIYDLNSTHGTFLNKGRLKSRIYAPVKVGHMLKLGFSSRSYILTGPEADAEEESEFTMTELKQQRAEKLLKQEVEEKEALLKAEQAREEKRKRDEERGIDWGLGEDADEDTDLTENPYAQTSNEELYLDDPKKALRGFMEREGHNLEYDCTEQGFGQFLCKVELPIDNDYGRPIVAEVLHKGKKKEAVVQCALEACRILDRYGVLRQATHESRKRKTKNWEENDYYDSDDDTYLDRTGTIEKKREKRMQSKLPQQPETYQSLLEKEKQINQEIERIEKELAKGKGGDSSRSSVTEEDSLDSFMKDLKQSKLDKHTIIKLKSELSNLKVEHVKVVKLVNLAKPADLPPLVVDETNPRPGTSKDTKTKALPMIGKRLKSKLQLPVKPKDITETEKAHNNEEEQEEEEEEGEEPVKGENSAQSVQNQKPESSKLSHSQNIYIKIIELEKLITDHKFSATLQSHIADIKDLLQKVRDILEEEDKIQCDRKIIMAKGTKMKKHIDNLYETYDEDNIVRIGKQLNRIFMDIQDLSEKEHGVWTKLRLFNIKINLFQKELLQKINEHKHTKKESEKQTGEANDNEEFHSDEDEDEEGKELTQEELERRKKRNQRRIQQRKEKAEKEKQKGYQEDARKEDYNMWLPPQNQTGDGRTSLNEKYGY